MNLILKVNGVDLSKIVLDDRISSQARQGSIETTMQIVLEGDVEALRYIDLRGKLTAGVVESGQHQPAFGGLVNSGAPEGTSYVLRCTDPSQLLKEAKAGGGFGKGLLPAEIIYYLTQHVDPEGVDPKNFSISDTQTLADTSYFSRPRRFVYIAPLPSCVLSAGTSALKMVNSWIYTVAESVAADDRIIAGFGAQANAWQNSAWQNSETRVRFYVQAKDFSQALEKGRVRLQRLLDILSFGANYASATYPSKAGIQLFTYDRSRTLVDIEQTEWAFVRDTTGAERYWMHWSAPHRDHAPFSLNRQDPILSLYAIFQELAEADDEDLTTKDRALLNALHALHQVRQSVSAKDALSHVWRCMEFLLAGYSTEPLFSDGERKAILKASKAVIVESVGDEQDSNPLREEQKKRLENVLNQQLNQTPLRTTWKLFCADHYLQYPDDDENFLWILRRNRNDHQHGRSTEVSRSDIERAATMMEKALVAAVVARPERVDSV